MTSVVERGVQLLIAYSMIQDAPSDQVECGCSITTEGLHQTTSQEVAHPAMLPQSPATRELEFQYMGAQFQSYQVDNNDRNQYNS